MAEGSIDTYIAAFPAGVQPILGDIRAAIRRAAPGASETISYKIPTFDLNGKHLVFFAGWKQFISLYPVPSVDAELERQLAPYRAAKSTLRFPLDKPVPYDLVERVVAVLVEQQ